GIHSVFPFRWFRLSEQIDRRGRNGMNFVLRRPGYGSWGRARTGSWLRTNWRAPTKLAGGWLSLLRVLGDQAPEHARGDAQTPRDPGLRNPLASSLEHHDPHK